MIEWVLWKIRFTALSPIHSRFDHQILLSVPHTWRGFSEQSPLCPSEKSNVVPMGTESGTTVTSSHVPCGLSVSSPDRLIRRTGNPQTMLRYIVVGGLSWRASLYPVRQHGPLTPGATPDCENP